MDKKKKPPRRPRTFVLIYLLVIMVYILSLFLSASQFKREIKTFQERKRLVAAPETFQQLPKKWLGPHWLFLGQAVGFAVAFF